MVATSHHGWLQRLRRHSAVCLLLFTVVLLVGVSRADALALAVGDDESCGIMARTFGVRVAAPADPTDLADPVHACCDLGACLDASALPPVAPALAVLASEIIARDVSRPRHRPIPRARRAGFRPRDPPGRRSSV